MESKALTYGVQSFSFGRFEKLGFIKWDRQVERKRAFIKFEVTQLTTWPPKVLQALAMRVLRNPIF
jgi:hypothetical protein